MNGYGTDEGSGDDDSNEDFEDAPGVRVMVIPELPNLTSCNGSTRISYVLHELIQGLDEEKISERATYASESMTWGPS